MMNNAHGTIEIVQDVGQLWPRFRATTPAGLYLDCPTRRQAEEFLMDEAEAAARREIDFEV